MGNIFLEILDEQDKLEVPTPTIRDLAIQIFNDADIVSGKLSIVIIDNETIHDLNKQFLQHDYATDVLSFKIEENTETGFLEGEIAVSAEMAIERAPEFGWHPIEELLLYVVHGVLHLVGYDDIEPEDRVLMRDKERYYLNGVGITTPPPCDEDNDVTGGEISDEYDD
jgi:probable rRNA maturation factor